MKRDFKGVWICKEIWLDKTLTWMEKLLLVEINSLDSVDTCFASNNHFAKFFDLSASRISQMVNSLIKKKYITVLYEREGKQIKKRTLIVINNSIKDIKGGIKDIKGGIKDIKGGIKDIKGGYLEYCEDNNTDINNTINNTINKYIERKSAQGKLPIQEEYEYNNNTTIKNYYEENLEYIDFWNTLCDQTENNTLSKIKTDKPSKTISNICEKIHHIKNNTFTKKYKLDSYKYKDNYPDIDDTKIKRTIRKYFSLQKEGYCYSTDNYDQRPKIKNMDGFLYNLSKKSSYFYSLLEKSVFKRDVIEKKENENRVPLSIQTRLENALGTVYTEHKDKFLKSIGFLTKELQKRYTDKLYNAYSNSRRFEGFYKTPELLILGYIDYLLQEKLAFIIGEGMSGHFKIDAHYFGEYLEEIEQEHLFTFDVDNEKKITRYRYEIDTSEHRAIKKKSHSDYFAEKSISEFWDVIEYAKCKKDMVFLIEIGKTSYTTLYKSTLKHRDQLLIDLKKYATKRDLENIEDIEDKKK